MGKSLVPARRKTKRSQYQFAPIVVCSLFELRRKVVPCSKLPTAAASRISVIRCSSLLSNPPQGVAKELQESASPSHGFETSSKSQDWETKASLTPLRLGPGCSKELACWFSCFEPTQDVSSYHFAALSQFSDSKHGQSKTCQNVQHMSKHPVGIKT